MLTLLLSLATPVFAAEGKPPRRAVPVTVLREVDDLEVRFERALALDCAEERCFPTGCTYVDHAVADRPRGGSLPGLGDPGAGPGSVEAQAWLTSARCGYAHEPAATAADVQVLTRRLQARVSTGWTSVSVSARPLDELPEYFRDAPETEGAEEEVVEEPEAPPAPFTAGLAARQLWDALLPHAFWMVGMGLFGMLGAALMWSLRRVGQPTIEERMLLAELDTPTPAAVTAEEPPDEDPSLWVAAQEQIWRDRLSAEPIDPALRALVRQRLKAGDIPLLAKAMLRFPDHFPAVFPSGGDVASAKVELADFLEEVSPEDLPSDQDFFAALHRHAAAATVSSQSDAEIVRRLRDDFGAAGLADLTTRLSGRAGGLLFALAPAQARAEVAGLLGPRGVAEMADGLLRSARMSTDETDHLFSVLSGGPTSDSPLQVTDRGTSFDAAGALSTLLERLAPSTRHTLFASAIRRSNSTLPRWTTGIFTADMLDALPPESRADLLLEVPVEGLAAWVGTLLPSTADQVKAAMPGSLATSVQAVSRQGTPTERARHAAEGHAALAQAFQRQLTRLDLRFEDIVVPPETV